ncbi:MAG: hypothetical protein CMJ18_13745 [Phycisphaeraceae bacterium]|nr:hypothetical protein [Phycisphaeraceae bacterium]
MTRHPALIVMMGLTLAGADTVQARVLFLAHFDGPGATADFAAGSGKAASVEAYDIARAVKPGRWGTALDLTDPRRRCTFPAEGNLDPRQGTLDFWFRVDHTEEGMYHPLVGWYHEPGKKQTAFELYGKGRRFEFNLYEDGRHTNASGDGFGAQRWHHVAITWHCTGGAGRSEYNVYINGRNAIRMTGRNPLGRAGGALHVGVWDYGYGHFLRGRVDELRITSRVEHAGAFNPPKRPYAIPGTEQGLLTTRRDMLHAIGDLRVEIRALRRASEFADDKASRTAIVSHLQTIREGVTSLKSMPMGEETPDQRGEVQVALDEVADRIKEARREAAAQSRALIRRIGRFQDVTTKVDLDIDGGASAWGDYNGDGLVDLNVNGKVFRNLSGLRFKQVAEIGAGVWADFDNDGRLDAYHWAGNGLYVNRGNAESLEFARPVTMPDLPAGREISYGTNRSANWADYNGDGFADLFVTGYEGGGMAPYHDTLMLSRSAQSFAGTTVGSRANGRGVTSCDFDEDGDIDVYVSNYRLQPNRLWRNDGEASFENVAASHGATGGNGHSIGAAWGDVDNDGDFDLFVGNFAHPGQPQSRFLENRGAAADFRFADRGTCGVAWQESYGTPALADYDNDGDLDLFFTTVYGGNHPRLYRNDGDWQFRDVTEEAGLTGLGATYQAAWADYDDDGDLDLLTSARLFRNNCLRHHWLKVRLVGGNGVDRCAIGAQARVHLDGATLTRQIEAGTGEANQNDLTLHFGLGRHDDRVTVEIVWPGGRRQAVTTKVDRTIIVEIGS